LGKRRARARVPVGVAGYAREEKETSKRSKVVKAHRRSGDLTPGCQVSKREGGRGAANTLRTRQSGKKLCRGKSSSSQGEAHRMVRRRARQRRKKGTQGAGDEKNRGAKAAV